jgi:hypothetical protein
LQRWHSYWHTPWPISQDDMLDVAVIALPMLRPLRALRVLTVLGFLNRQSSAVFRGRVITYVIGATTLVVFIASVAQLDAERHGDDANITTHGDALWWAVSTRLTAATLAAPSHNHRPRPCGHRAGNQMWGIDRVKMAAGQSQPSRQHRGEGCRPKRNVLTIGKGARLVRSLWLWPPRPRHHSRGS